MVTPMLHELAGGFPLFLPFDGVWFLHERTGQHLIDAWERTR